MDPQSKQQDGPSRQKNPVKRQPKPKQKPAPAAPAAKPSPPKPEKPASGISDYRTFFVGALPAVAEKEPNTDFASPQAIPLGVQLEQYVLHEILGIVAVAGQPKGEPVHSLKVRTDERRE